MLLCLRPNLDNVPQQEQLCLPITGSLYESPTVVGNEGTLLGPETHLPIAV